MSHPETYVGTLFPSKMSVMIEQGLWERILLMDWENKNVRTGRMSRKMQSGEQTGGEK